MSDDFDAAARRLLLMDKVVGASLEEAAAAGAAPLRDETKRRAPRGATLQLAESVEDKPVEASKNRAVHAVVVGKYYGYFHEYSTSKMAAHPFLRPAVDATKTEVAAAVAGVVLKASRSVTG